MCVETTIRSCTIVEIEQSSTLQELLEAYSDESRIPELGQVCPSFEAYRQMEAAGALHLVGVFAPDLVGLASLLVYGLPHYAGRRICTMESLFVVPAFRAGGTGLKLLRATEARALELGAIALMVSAPVGGRLAKVLPRSGYRQTNEVFLRALA